MSNSNETAEEPDKTTIIEEPADNVLPWTGQTAIDRAYDIARSGSPDAEIAAILACEYGLEPDEIRKKLEPRAIRDRLAAERTAGKAELRNYLFKIATAPKHSRSSLQVAMWLSRQYLGYSQQGVSDDLQKKMDQLDSLSEKELKDYILKVAKNLGG